MDFSSWLFYLGYFYLVLSHRSLASSHHSADDAQTSSISYQPAYVVPGHVAPVLLTNKTISRRTARLWQRQEVDCRLFGEVCDASYCCSGTGACCGTQCCDVLQGTLCIDGQCCPINGCGTSGGNQVSLRDVPAGEGSIVQS